MQFPDNQPKFQVIELDRPSWPPDIEMSEEKIICLIAPAAPPPRLLLHHRPEDSTMCVLWL